MSNNIVITSAIILCSALLIAQLIIYVMIKMRPDKDYQELVLRTRSWWWIVVLVETSLYFGKTSFIVLLGLVSFFAMREYLSRVHTRRSDRDTLFLLFLAIPMQFVLIYRGMFIEFLCFVPLYSMSVIVLALLVSGPPRGFIMALGTAQIGLFSTVYSLGHFAYLGLSDDPNSNQIIAGNILLPIFLTQINDVFQYMCGKAFGKHKIMPQISPKKTIEGFSGGLILTSSLAAVIAPYVTSLTHLQGFVAGLTLASLGFLGDVLMSAIKRDLDIKDFSQLVPGHGGILDRIDSLIIAVPIYFHLVRAFSNGWLS
ncbi:MAG: phosphatidate cytidylyltransferase [Chitinophagaceae bacterium]|nr:phosphatidate cytidylyltransferase [Oligoflexus sp.]